MLLFHPGAEMGQMPNRKHPPPSPRGSSPLGIVMTPFRCLSEGHRIIQCSCSYASGNHGGFKSYSFLLVAGSLGCYKCIKSSQSSKEVCEHRNPSPISRTLSFVCYDCVIHFSPLVPAVSQYQRFHSIGCYVRLPLSLRSIGSFLIYPFKRQS